MQQSGNADLCGMVVFFPPAGGAWGMAIALSCLSALVLAITDQFTSAGS